ncbi:MAG: VanW family protein, partial [Clostridia bacterium]|nr:VanW family protein [Clostridia bacterium]
MQASNFTRGKNKAKTKETAARTDGQISSASVARQRIQKRKEREKKRRMRIMATLLTVALALIIAGTVALVITSKVYTYEGIYPNVRVAGVDLEGMNEEEAASAIKKASEEYYASQKVTLSYGDDKLDIYGSEIDMSMDAPAAARAAMAYGKHYSFFTRTRIVNGKTEPVDLAATTSFNPVKIEAKVNEFTEMVKDKSGVCSYELTDTVVKVDLSANGEVLNKATIVNDVSRMFGEGRFETYEAVPEVVTAATLDVEEIYESVYCDAEDAEILYVPLDWTEETADQYDLASYSGKKTYYVKPERIGLSFDLEGAKMILAANANGKVFQFPLIKSQPQVTKAELSSKIYSDVIGRASSTLNPGEVNRTTNVRLATEFVNGTELMPGEVFSYNKIVGERTEKRGFKDAGTFVKGEVVDEIGGGICQLSSTVYMATLRSNLKQVSRSAHRFAVTYTPLGQDATVYWGSLDYQIKNDTDYPIKD